MPTGDRWVDGSIAVYQDLAVHEMFRAGRPCGCVRCRILAVLDGTDPRLRTFPRFRPR